MKKKLIVLYMAVNILILLASYIIDDYLLIFIFNLSILFFEVSFMVLNFCIKKTNGYKNNFIYTTQFISMKDSYKLSERRYDIVNLGSNSARYAFFYEFVLGQNWSTGTQGILYDFEILKLNFSLLKRQGIVLLSLCPFSSIVTYLKKDKTDMLYHAKFARILNSFQQRKMISPVLSRLIRYPLLFNVKSIRYLLKDIDKDNRLLISEQSMQPLELNADAAKWINGWKKQFDIKDLSTPVTNVYKECIDESVKQLQEIIIFCLERELKPILIIPPVTKYLSEYFTPEVREQYIYSFIRQANTKDVPFLDYFSDERFQEPALYFNSFFLNLRGRKLFTRQVLRDLAIVGE
jgi:hypothetical protein